MRPVCTLVVVTLLAVAAHVLLAQELPPFPFEVPEDNGWDDYVAAADLLHEQGRPESQNTPWRVPLAPGRDELAEWAFAVEANADVLELVAQSSADESVIPPEAAGDAAG